jgi:hypothetical protein
MILARVAPVCPEPFETSASVASRKSPLLRMPLQCTPRANHHPDLDPDGSNGPGCLDVWSKNRVVKSESVTSICHKDVTLEIFKTTESCPVPPAAASEMLRTVTVPYRVTVAF